MAAHADTLPTTLYVSKDSSACSDAGSGTSAVPFCTIQAAANVVQPGQTVLVRSALYTAKTDITRSGTSGAPITFESDPLATTTIGGGVAHAFTVTGASNIVIKGFTIGATTKEAFLVADSSAVTLDSLSIDFEGGTGDSQIHVTGNSSQVTISRDSVAGSTQPSILIDPGTASTGGSGDVITTNKVFGGDGAGIWVRSTPNVAVTSNTVDGACESGIALTGTSTGATIENNIVESTIPVASASQCVSGTGTTGGLVVDAQAASGATENYNIVYPGSYTATNYVWSGVSYSSAAQLHAATGQGAADINAEALAGVGGEPPVHSPAIDSANSSAPGELTTDVSGNPRVDDPLVPNTGAGTYSYYDRGAAELQDAISITSQLVISSSATGNPISQAPTGAALTAQLSGADSWGGVITYAFDFGDGTAKTSNTTGSATHAYATTGTFNVDVTMTSTEGGIFGASNSVTIVSTALSPALTATVTSALAVSVDASASTDPWSIYAYDFSFGDGSSTGSVSSPTITHTYSQAGTYTITVMLADGGGTNATKSISYTTKGSDYSAYGPVRILDTRNGTGASLSKVSAGGVVQLKIEGNGSIPSSGVTAVALNLTATNTSGSGFVTAYPDGPSRPDVSNLNYTAGRTVPNAVIVPVGSDGYIDLSNSGSTAGPIDLIADVTGYFTLTSASGYTALPPSRLLDTRTGTGAGKAPVAAGGRVTLAVAGADAGSLPASGITAVALNVTVTDSSGTGFVTAYPDGTSTPSTSSLNYVPGQTVANTVIVPVGSDGKIDLLNAGSSAGPVDLIADVTGYYGAGSTGAYFPVAPTRLLDTRNTSALAKGGTVSVTASSADSAVPSSASGYVFNLTVTQPTGTGFITAYPAGESEPNVSNLNYTPGLTIANGAQVSAGTGGAVDFANGGSSAGSTQLIVDVFGYYASS